MPSGCVMQGVRKLKMIFVLGIVYIHNKQHHIGKVKHLQFGNHFGNNDFICIYN